MLSKTVRFGNLTFSFSGLLLILVLLFCLYVLGGTLHCRNYISDFQNFFLILKRSTKYGFCTTPFTITSHFSHTSLTRIKFRMKGWIHEMGKGGDPTRVKGDGWIHKEVSILDAYSHQIEVVNEGVKKKRANGLDRQISGFTSPKWNDPRSLPYQLGLLLFTLPLYTSFSPAAPLYSWRAIARNKQNSSLITQPSRCFLIRNQLNIMNWGF